MCVAKLVVAVRVTNAPAAYAARFPTTHLPDVMRYRLLLPALLLFLPLVASAQDMDVMPMALPDISYEMFTLNNGLTLIVHEDHKAPIVAINVWYHVGSKNEPMRRSGFAHLFEHLMFNGSENFDDDYFQALERVGATDLNGMTNEDRTNYFQNVPTNAVDLALWMESDRMGHLLGAIDQEKLDEQRGVVQNEKRQGENQPYGQVNNKITRATYPAGHPYAHTVIGSMDDLNAATLDDVKEWFKTYYGPNNAVVAIAGDINAAEAKALAEQYFGDIAPGPPVSHFDAWIAKRVGEQREIMQDRVPQARIYKVWNIPEVFSEDYHLLDLASSVLASGKNSRLYKRLVYTDQIATDVGSYVSGGEIGSQFFMRATARPGQDLGEVEKVMDEEFMRFLEEGPTQEELQRIITQEKAGFIRGIERIGGFGGKSDILARGQIYGGSPEAYKTSFRDKDQATTESVRMSAEAWLTDGVYVLEVHPFPELSAAEGGADREGLPDVDEAPEAVFPAVQTAQLSNGLSVLLAQRHATPVVEITLQLDAGYAADQGAIQGTASLAMSMLDEGTETLSALEINDLLANLGARISAGSDLDGSFVSLSSLKENLTESLDLFADVILHPAFPQQDFDRLQQQRLASIQREKISPVSMALRVFPQLLYGEGHAYSLPFTGSGTEASVSSLTREDVSRFHETWFRPNIATLVVVGDATMEELQPLLEERFGSWAPGDVPTKNIAVVAHKPSQCVYLMDRPGSQQSIIFAAHVAPPRNTPNNIAIETMNTILGGSFTSRINMNLREEKGWSYGAQSIVLQARGQRPFLVFAPVQTDKTSESMTEIAQELRGILAEDPPSEEEVLKAQQNQTLTLAGRWETNSAVEGSIINMVQYDLPDDYYDTYTEKVRSLNVPQVSAAAQDVVRPNNLIWIVVGDLAVIEPAIRALELGEVHHMDADGNVLDAQ